MNKDDLFQQVKTEIDKIPDEFDIWVACSGGCDSVALTYLTKEISLEKLKGIVYFNHNQRGETELSEDIALIEKISSELSIDKSIGNWKDAKKNLGEDKLRKVRYDFFDKFINKRNIILLLGHTLDDQIETFFLNLLRGTGLKGLLGIPEYRDKNIYRPLLNITKEELKKFLKNNNILFRDDITNYSIRFKRNLIRLKLIPLIENISGKDIRILFSRTISSLKEDDKIISFFLEEYINEVASEDSEGYTIDLKNFNSTPKFIHRRILRLAALKAGIPYLSAIQTDRLLSLSYNLAGHKLDCGYISAYRKKNKLYIRSTFGGKNEY